jgi:ELWxxDGT repeat protein
MFTKWSNLGFMRERNASRVTCRKQQRRNRSIPRVEPLEDRVLMAATLVKDIQPGAMPSSPHFLTSAMGRVFFAADDGTNGTVLWVSDGTAAGTQMVKDRDGNLFFWPQYLTNVNGTLYFDALDGTFVDHLCKVDNTVKGTGIIGNNLPGGLTRPSGFTLFKNKIYFAAFGQNGCE